jgi:hypothetical protein
VTADAGLIAVHAFPPTVDMAREEEMRARFGRVHLCRHDERPG